jgi:hypothetical protein
MLTDLSVVLLRSGTGRVAASEIKHCVWLHARTSKVRLTLRLVGVDLASGIVCFSLVWKIFDMGHTDDGAARLRMDAPMNASLVDDLHRQDEDLPGSW